MSNKFPVVNADTFVKFLKAHGFEKRGQRGSHISMIKEGMEDDPVIVPNHKPVKVGTALTILKSAGLTKADLVDYLQNKSRRTTR